MTTTRRPLTDSEREARRAEQRALVTAAIEQLRSSDGWQAYLKGRARFRAYSTRNVLMIVPAAPDRGARRGVSGVAGAGVLPGQGQPRHPDLGAVPTRQTSAAGLARRRR